MEKPSKRLVCRICQDTFTNPAEHQKDTNHLRLTPGTIRVSGFNSADRDQVLKSIEKMGGVSSSRFGGKYWQVFYDDKKSANYIIHTPVMFKGKPLEISWRRPGFGPPVILSTFEANRKRTLEAKKERKKEAAAAAARAEEVALTEKKTLQDENSTGKFCWTCIEHYNDPKHLTSSQHVEFLPRIVRVTGIKVWQDDLNVHRSSDPVTVPPPVSLSGPPPLPLVRRTNPSAGQTKKVICTNHGKHKKCINANSCRFQHKDTGFVFKEKSEVFTRIQKQGGVARHTFDSGQGIMDVHYPARKPEAFDLIKNIETIYPEKNLTVSWQHDNQWITKSEAEQLAKESSPGESEQLAGGAAKKDKSKAHPNNTDADAANDVAAAEGTMVKTGKTIGDIIRSLKTCETFDSQLLLLQTEILPDRQLYVAKRDIVFQDLQAILKVAGKKWNTKNLEPICFGSNATGLNTLISDFDIFISTDKPSKGVHLLKIMSYHMNKVLPGMFVKVYLIENARVPILRCFHKETSTLCDINATHPLGVNNSQMIKYYLNLDPKLTPLALLIKFWAESHGLKKVNQFNTYMLCWMVIFYLQQTYDVPSVRALQKNHAEFIVDNWNVAFKKIKDYQNEPLKNASMTKLLTGFFDFYRRFDFVSSVVCPYLGRTLRKSDFFSPLKLPDDFMLYQNYALANEDFFKPNSFLAIQDPIEHVRNISFNVTSNSVVKFGFLCEIACEVFRSKKQNEILCHMLNPKDLSTMTELAFSIDPPGDVTADLWFDAVDSMAQCSVEKVLKCELTLIEQPSKPACLADETVTNQIAYYCNGMLSVFEDRLEILKKLETSLSSSTSDFEQEIAVTNYMAKECPKVVRMLFSMSLFSKTETGGVVVVIRGSSTCRLLHQVNHFLRVKLPKWSVMYWKRDAKFFGNCMEFMELSDIEGDAKETTEEVTKEEEIDEKDTNEEVEECSQPPPAKKPRLLIRSDLLQEGVDLICNMTPTKDKSDQGEPSYDVSTIVIDDEEDDCVVLVENPDVTIVEPSAFNSTGAVESNATVVVATESKDKPVEPAASESSLKVRSKTPDTPRTADKLQRTAIVSTPDKSASDMDVCSTDDDPDRGATPLSFCSPKYPGMTPSENATDTQNANMEIESVAGSLMNTRRKSQHTNSLTATTTSTNETNAIQSAENQNVTVSNGKANENENGEEEEDVPADFFDDFSNQDFMDGLDIVDAWDDDCTGTKRAASQTLVEEGQLLSSGEDTTGAATPSHSHPSDPSVQFSGQYSDSSSKVQTDQTAVTPDKSPRMKDPKRLTPPARGGRRRRKSSSPKRRNRSPPRKRSSSPRKRSDDSPRKRASRTSSSGVTAERSRRDPEKTRRDIEKHKLKCAKDQELKVVTDKLRLMESGLVPPGTEAEYDLNVMLKESRQKKKEEEEKAALVESSPRKKLSKSPKKKRRSHSRERKRSPLGKASVLSSRSSNSQREKEWARFIRRRSHSSSPDSRRRKRSRSRDRSRERDRNRSRSRSPYSKKSRRVEHKKSFLEEIRDKLNAIPPSSATSLPVPYPTMPQGPYPLPVPVPAPVPAPVRYFPPTPVPSSAAVPPPQQRQQQLYDQQFFIGGMPYTLSLPAGGGNPATAYPVRVPQQQQQAAVVVGGGGSGGGSIPVPTLQLPPFNSAGKGSAGQKKEQEASAVAKPDIDKLFEDKKISLSDFLTITAKPEVQSSTPEHLQKKIKVISRCQDAIRIMSLEKKISGRLSVASSKPPSKPQKPEMKYQSPLRKVPVIRFQFTTPSKSSAADSNGDGFAMAIDKVLQSVGIIQETISLDDDESPDKGNNKTLREEESRLAQSLKAKLATITSPLKKKQGFQAVSGPTLAPSGCEECRKRKSKGYTEVAIQCATDVKSTNTIGTQVCEDDLRKPSDSFVHLTPAQLLNKEKGTSSMEEKRMDEQKNREVVTPTKDEVTTPVKVSLPKRSPPSGGFRGHGNPRSGHGGGNQEDLRNLLERGSYRPGAPYPNARGGYPPRFPMDMVNPGDPIFFDGGYDREFIPPPIYPPNYYPPLHPRYGDPRF